MKRCDHTDANKEDQGYLMPDLLDYLDSISSKQDPYSKKQWNQQSKCRDIPDSINSQSYDDPRVCTCCYGEHHILFDTDISNKQKGQSDRSQSICRYLKQADDCDGDEEYVVSASSTSSGSRRKSDCLRSRNEKQVSSYQEPLKHANPTEWFIMEEKKWGRSYEGKVSNTRPA